MKKTIRFKIGFSLITIVVAMTLILPANAVAVGIDANNDDINEQKIYAEANINDSFADDAVLVMFSNKVSMECNAFTVNDFSEIELNKVRNLSSVLEERVAKAKENIVRTVTQGEQFVLDTGLDMSEFNQVFRLELSETGKDQVLKAISILEKREDIIYVGPDYIGTYCSDDYSDDNDENYFINEFAKKWAYEQILLEEARDVMRANDISEQTIRIAVVDTGIDTDHVALDHNIVNENDSDTYGTECENGAVVDSAGHGTNVAGIIFGVAQTVELISFKTSESTYTFSSAALEAIIAISNFDTPIPIMNFGLRWKIAEGSQTGGRYDAIISDALNDYDGLIVCPAGNDSANIGLDYEFDYYPIQHAIPNMIVVGASTQTDGVKSDSNHGFSYVDVFAPGENIYTINKNGGYMCVGQTSNAAPFVTGLAAMLLMVNEDLTADDLIEIITATVDTAYTPGYVEGVAVNKGANIQNLYNVCSSHGRINAYKAVLEAIDYDTTPACTHSNYYYTYDATTHTLRCSDCSYTSSASHDLYVFTDYGESGVTIKCYQCNFERFCDIGVAEYSYGGENGHYVSCTCGCYSFFTAHRVTYIMQTSSLTTHNVYCGDCGTTYPAAHSWIPSGFGYECALCAMTTLTIPDIMQIPSGDEILIASGDENGTAIALLPEKEDDLVTE